MFAPKARTFAAMSLAFAMAVSVALGQVKPSRPIDAPVVRHTPMPLITAIPLPGATVVPSSPRPIGSPGDKGRAYPPGTKVPLSQLPPLPMRTFMNTVKANSYRNKLRPMAGTGMTVSITGSTCSNLVGELFPTGCSVNFAGANLGGSKYQDYIIATNATTATAAGGQYTGNADPGETVNLTNTGTYTLGVYDVTAAAWVAVIYINAGSIQIIRVYQDSFFTEETYQFDASSSGDAYIHMTNIAPSDLYVVDIESTSIHPACVFSSPTQTGGFGVGVNALCNPANSAGQQAPGGSLSVAWPITAATAAGTYSITLYDKTLSERVAQVQVSVTGSSGITMTLDPDLTGANANAPPSPAPAVGASSSTIFAWDSANEQSVSGVTLGVGSLPAHNYTWSFNDPAGNAAAQNGPVALSGIANQSFTFTGAGLLTPGTYPARIFTAGIYDNTANSMYASQAFKVLGYNSTTFFHSASDASALSVAQGSNVTTTLKLLNSGDLQYGTGNGDGFAGLAYTTGTDFLATNGNGNGIEMTLAGKTLAQCVKPAGCSTTVSDSNGIVWTVSDFCSDATGTQAASECYVLLMPQTGGNVLPVGSTISIPNMVFYNAAGSNCNAQCSGATSELPAHGVQWSRVDSGITDGYYTTYFNNGAATLTGTGHVALVGAITVGAGRITSPGQPEVHAYQTRFQQATYGFNTPYTVSNNDYVIIGLTIKNGANSSPIATVAVAQPGPWAGQTTLNNIGVDTTLNNNWRLVGCPGLSNAYSCFGGRSGHTIAKNTTETIYIDENVTPQDYGYIDWVVQSLSPNFSITADNAAVAVPVNSPALNVDSMAFAQYALDSSQMAASFSPGTAGTNSSPTESIVVTNESSAADPNPEYVDAIVIELPNATTVTAESATAPWSYLGKFSTGGNTFYWYGLCAAQYVNANTYLPPLTSPNAAVQNALPQCTGAQENNSLAPGGTFTGSITFSNLTANVTATMFAHGANVNGWSAGKSFTLPVAALSASSGFSNAGAYGAPPAVSANTVPTIGGNSNAGFGNSYVYSFKNTSKTTNVTSFRVRIPGTDVSGTNAYDGTNAWHVTNAIPTLGGNVGTCTITNAIGAQAATVGGADGEIDVGGCALLPGQTVTLSFSMIGPQSQSDSYLFTSYCINNLLGSCTLASGISAGENWLGDTRVQVQLSIGLSVTVDPSNPGPGASNPIVNCPGCSFSGSTVDVGTVGSNSTASFQDIVRASIFITSATVVNWTLSVQTTNNPVNSTGTPSNELLIDVDGTRSSSGAGINVDVPAFTVVPQTPTAALQIAHGASIPARSTPYDILENFEVSIGNESIMPQSSVITYQLIAN